MSNCEEVKELLGLPDTECCGSCHEDCDEYNYDLCEVAIGGRDYFVCCKVWVATGGAAKVKLPERP
jgi:hypothetical protein